jgi:hypothetical protein
MSDQLLPGTEIEMGGRNWVVPPLTLGQLRRLAGDIGRIGERSGVLDGEAVGAVVRIVTAALQRNYPDLGEQAVEEMLDLGNTGQVLSAVLTGSGLRRGAGSGEVSAPASAGASLSGDGTNSTASSPPPSAGASATLTN